MRTDPKTLLRGVVKLVAVVVVAGLVGAGLGIGLAKLSGNDGDGTAALPAPTTATASTTADGPPPTTTVAAAEASPPPVAQYREPSVKVLSALLGPTRTAGRALVAVKLRVTNRGDRPIDLRRSQLLSGRDEVPVNAGSSAASALPLTLAPAKSATGKVRFTLPPAVARRLNAKPSARLRLARRILTLKLTKQSR